MLLKKNIPFKYVFGKIKTEILLVSLYTISVTVAYTVFHVTDLAIPLAVPMIMGTVISLLLAFRSNQAYDRWWEARTIWGAIVNDSRSLARQINHFVSVPSDKEQEQYFKTRYIKRQIAWCYSLSRSLRGQDPLAGSEKFISRNELQTVKRFTNSPMALLEQHGADSKKALNNGFVNSFQQVEIDRTLSRLADSMGKCERIKNTVFPATYSLYIHFSLLFFFLLLPFALIDVFGAMTIPVIMAIAAAFFLIEKMAIHLQDPFENKPTDTPMTAICFTIERDLRQVVNEIAHPVETVNHPNEYYVL
jgi:putative membrane protein